MRHLQHEGRGESEWSVARGLRVEACLHEVLFCDHGIAGVAEKHEHVTAVVVDIAPCIAPRLAASTAWAGLGDVVHGTVHRDRHDRRSVFLSLTATPISPGSKKRPGTRFPLPCCGAPPSASVSRSQGRSAAQRPRRPKPRVLSTGRVGPISAKPNAAPMRPPPLRPAPAASTAPKVTGNAVFPTAVSPKYSGESAGKARMHTC